MEGKGENKSIKCFFLCCILLFVVYPLTAYANSSWHWVTASPMKVLPAAVVLTLAIETWGVIIYGKVNEKLRVLIVVTFANIVSFVMPYVIYAYRIKFYGVGYGAGWDYAWGKAFNSGPSYMVRFGYLLLTLCIEVPIVYLFLKNRCKSKKRLIFILIALNVITTIIVGVMERLLCQGQW